MGFGLADLKRHLGRRRFPRGAGCVSGSSGGLSVLRLFGALNGLLLKLDDPFLEPSDSAPVRIEFDWRPKLAGLDFLPKGAVTPACLFQDGWFA
jgi:hypothetical protein